ncbi:carboxylesterase family protein [Paenibacillus apiarius]|uniref:Carboxylic ester hydrolase n=1 Tax=Paenibacillus apiarius TaxID=46240 RepID=A0ABT4E1M8_9BACL|nr:carboxylesterase family protein [Paenibacillus apiarius]MCY9516442.1 carboxylesterase family protein [Paenibacillus apiarius]MCY9523496.1 carboxylesterase family protein [Paenibacillus apiarius]MCY9554284.1 carboxylesterase family protein [Paenibacillus apiarius]MCY9561621.1 carboxylesterase family protein [Paenibacillus apiarius]MCY9687041.1 carboxylesterase family protein [Paenibacillus apiarius]
MEYNRPIVICEQGKLVGTQEKQALAFYNVPYGADKGRFMTVGEPVTWSGTREATTPGPVFPQLPSRLSTVLGTKKEELNQKEDAFSLNIWTKDTNKKRPVLFWIHGGGWLTGGGSLPWYNGSDLVTNEDGDVVVVTVNYRLGALGNLFLPGISEGNLALKDLIAALHWVKKNIEAFGGDPDLITVAGQSAGAWYSVALMACEEVQGMFNRTALFSFPACTKALNESASLELSNLLLERLGIDERNKEKILDVPIEQILSSQTEVTREMQRRNNDILSTFLPIVDGVLLKGDIRSEAVRISGGNVNVIAGITAEETAIFFYQTDLRNKDNYFELVEASSKEIFGPTHEFMLSLNEGGSDTYLFEFNYPSPDPYLLACHCIDLPFVFGNFEKWDNAPMLEDIHLEEAQNLSDQVQGYFLRFIKNGSPNHENSLDWLVFERNHRNVLLFDKKIELKS